MAIFSWKIILWHYYEKISFNKLQKLNIEYSKLISINKIYISDYTENYSLLKIEQYAKENLAMFLPREPLKNL